MQHAAEVLEERLDYQFRDKHLLLRALTHRSWLAERGSPTPDEGDNEQLEFLGDSVLGFVVSEALVLALPAEREGRLSQIKAHLVSAAHLYQCALALGLGEFLQLGRGEEQNGGRQRKTLLANGMEALIAAMHLDGGLEVAKRFIEKRVLANLDTIRNVDSGGLLNYKSQLQERAQALGYPPPRYITVSINGPEHAKQFTVEARVGGAMMMRATDSSKKAAGQRAAESLCRELDRKDSPDLLAGGE